MCQEERRLAHEREEDEWYVSRDLEDGGVRTCTPGLPLSAAGCICFDLKEEHYGGQSSSFVRVEHVACKEQLRLAQAEAEREARRAAEELEDGRVVTGVCVCASMSLNGRHLASFLKPLLYTARNFNS